MTRRIGTLFVCLSLAAVGACGSGNKKDPAKPGDGSAKKTDGDQSMKDPGSDPTAPPGTTGGTTGGTPTTPGGPATPGTPTGPTSGGPDISGPPVTMPNYDRDPGQAKTEVDAHLRLARAALSQQIPDGELALKEARLALAADASSIDAAAMIAFAYYHKKLYDTAELVLDELFNAPSPLRSAAAKKNPQCNYVYGLIYDRTNRPEQAQLAFKMAVELDGNFASALVNHGMYQLKNSQYAAAQQTFEKLTKQLNRVDAVTLTSLGSAYRGRSAEFPQNNPERQQFVINAQAAYERALQVSGNQYAPAVYNLGLLYLDTDPFPGISDAVARLNKAKDQFDKYQKLPGFDTKLYDARMKDITRALKKAQQKKPAPAPKP